MIPAQNLIPVIRKEALTPTIRQALNAISAELTTKGLQQMNKRVAVDKVDPGKVAHNWVQQHADELTE
jgi:osmoprotectant transport system substrate-binding protein